MQKHARACNNSYQSLTPAFDGQVEGVPVPAMRPILPKILRHSNSDPGTNPQMLGLAPLLALGLPPGRHRRLITERSRMPAE
jgi:hypothetical protein